MKAQKLNKRQAHQALYLSRFDFILKHVPETKVGKTDGLSRRLDQKVGVENDNNNQVFIKNYWLHNLLEVVIEEPEIDILEKIKIARNKDKEVVRIVEEMKKAEVKILKREEWQIERDLVLKEEKVYVLKDEALRIFQLHHDILGTEYRGK